jgi:hypothetical protein
MGYITGGFALALAIAGFAIWVLMGQLSAKDVQIGELHGAVKTQNATINNMNTQFAASMVALGESRDANHESDLRGQRMQYANNELRLTIDQRNQDAPFVAGLDDHNWFSQWMQQVERAGSGKPAGPNHSSTGQTHPIGVPPD